MSQMFLKDISWDCCVGISSDLMMHGQNHSVGFHHNWEELKQKQRLPPVHSITMTVGLLVSLLDLVGKRFVLFSIFNNLRSPNNDSQKFDRRKRVVRQIIALKAEAAAPDFEVWEYFVKMLDLLGVDGMSSEEEDVRDFQGQTVTVFVVKLCFWRADEITQYIKFIDKEAPNIQGPQNRQTPRLGSEIPGTTLAKGLPRKMYNPQWLANMETRNKDYAEHELHVSKEVFDLLVLATHS